MFYSQGYALFNVSKCFKNLNHSRYDLKQNPLLISI